MTRFSLLPLALCALLTGACDGSGGTGQSFSGYGMQTEGYGMQNPVPDQQAYVNPIPQAAPATADWRSQVQVNHGQFQQMLNNWQQMAAAMGVSRQSWLFANEFTVIAILQNTMSGMQPMYAMGIYENGQEQAVNLVFLGQNQQGAYCLKTEFQDSNQPTIMVAPDLSWMTFNGLQLPAATPAQCDQAFANGQARSVHFAQRYYIFKDLFAAINKAYSRGVEDENNLFFYGNQQVAAVIAKIPSANALAIGEFEAWNTYVGDLYQQQANAQGGPRFLAVINGQQVPVEMTPNEMQIRINGLVLQRMTPENATQVVDQARLRFDKSQPYEFFVNQYTIWSNQYGEKLAYVNNANIKEVYKFSARAAMNDCQQKMREIRERAARVGYNIAPGAFEGANNGATQSALNNYQWARDGVTYGQSDPAYQVDNRGNWRPLQ